MSQAVKKNLPYIVAIIFLAAAVGGIFVMLNNLPRSLGTSPSSELTAVKPVLPIDLTGTWRTEGNEKPVMNAKVGAGTIEVQLVDDQGSIIFWYGSFENPKKVEAVIASTPVDNGKPYWSTEKAKDFTYKNGALYYQFSITGATKLIKLTRG